MGISTLLKKKALVVKDFLKKRSKIKMAKQQYLLNLNSGYMDSAKFASVLSDMFSAFLNLKVTNLKR